MIAVWIVIAVVALAVLATLLVLGRRRRLERDAARAGHLRREAQAHTGDIVATQQVVEDAEEDAAVAHQEAALADERLDAARQDLAAVEAQQEDALREADKLDPKRRSDDLDLPPAAPTGSHRRDV